MAGQPSTVGANNMLDALNGRATQTARTMYLALLTAAPTDATTMATMTELATPGSDGYSRQTVSWTAPSGDPSESENTGAITFGPLTADLGNVTHIALVSAATGTSGDLVWYWTADEAKDPSSGDSLTIAAGALTMSAD